jgi:hypothetical protein
LFNRVLCIDFFLISLIQVPVYDARKVVINFDVDLSRLDKVLPLFAGEVPSGSFVVVGYTVSGFKAGAQTGADRVPQIGFNIVWAIVCGTPDKLKGKYAMHESVFMLGSFLLPYSWS